MHVSFILSDTGLSVENMMNEVPLPFRSAHIERFNRRMDLYKILIRKQLSHNMRYMNHLLTHFCLQ